MPRYFTHYHDKDTWDYLRSYEGQPFRHASSSLFKERGVAPGDFLYIVTVKKGKLFLGSRLKIDDYVTRDEAVKETRITDLGQGDYHVLAKPGDATPLELDRCIRDEVVKLLKLGHPPSPLKFWSDTELADQTLRGVRELEPESAKLLDSFVEDVSQRSDQKDSILADSDSLASLASAYDEELAAFEGEARVALVRHRSRERWLRDEKLERARQAQGGKLRCEVPGCGFDFEDVYGELGRDYAQVHHLEPLGDRTDLSLTRLDDLVIVCANCHAMIHRGGQTRPLEGLLRPRISGECMNHPT